MLHFMLKPGVTVTEHLELAFLPTCRTDVRFEVLVGMDSVHSQAKPQDILAPVL